MNDLKILDLREFEKRYEKISLIIIIIIKSNNNNNKFIIMSKIIYK